MTLFTNNTDAAILVSLSDDKFSASNNEKNGAVIQGQKSGVLGSSLNKPAVIELDLDIDKLLSNMNAELIPDTDTQGYLRYVTQGVNVQVTDVFCTTATNSTQRNELFKFGLYYKNGELWLRHAYTEGGLTKTAEAFVADSVDRLAHVRVEYTYAPDQNGELSHDSVVSAKYFINGKLIAEGVNVRTGHENKTYHIGASANNALRVYIPWGTTNDEVTVSNYSISSVDTDALEELEAAAALDSKPSYLHAAYADMDNNGEIDDNALRLNVPLTSTVKVGAAWDWNNLYLRFSTAGATGVKIGNYTNNNVNGLQLVIPWTEILPASLSAAGAKNAQQLTISAGNVTWTGNLVLDTNNYKNWLSKENTVTSTDSAEGTKNFDGKAYLVANADVPIIFEMDLQLKGLEEWTYTKKPYGSRYSCEGLNFTITDSLARALAGGGYVMHAFKFGIYKSNGIVYLIHGADGDYESVPIGASDLDSYHIRIEYSYTKVGETLAVTDLVNAEYYVNGKLVASGENVRADLSSTTNGTGTKDNVVICRVTKGGSSANFTAFSASHAQAGVIDNKAAAETVDALINAIGTVTLNNEAAIIAAEEAYAALTSAQQALVTNYTALTAARATYDELKAAAEKEAADRAAAAEVDALINALPGVNDLKLTDRTQVEAARAAYAGLKADQVQYVTKREVLEDAEAKIVQLQAAADKLAEDQAAAAAVDVLINAIGAVTLESKNAIETAEEAYNNLTEDQKSLVANYETLTNARATYNALKETADQEALDRAAAAEVDVLIDAIGTVTLDSLDAIMAAEEAYNNLTEDQKSLVANYETLTEARNRYTALKAAADKELDDKAAAAEVDALIGAIGTVTLDSLDAIVAAEEAYNNLTEDQKVWVENHLMLADARAAYDILKAAAEKEAADKDAAAAVDALINALPGVNELKLTDKALVEAARAAYVGLKADQVQYVTKLKVLEDAEAKIAELQATADQETQDKAAAKAVDDQIAAIGTVTYSKANAIATVRNAYNDLSDAQKAFVENLETLTNAEAKIAQLQAQIDAVEAEIAAIGEVTLSDAEAIDQAKTAFEALAADQQAAVENATVLTAAQAALKALQDAVTAVIDQIDAIGNVTLESLADIEAAEAAYDALTDEQKALVTNHATLTEARATYDRLVSEKEAADKAAVDAVKSLIDVIGTVTLESEEAIQAAETAYAALTADQKTQVNNYADLTAARAAYDQLVAEKEAADKAAADQAAADAAIAKIEAIGTVTLESKLSIEAARVAYNALTEEQKALVGAEILLKLTNAEAALKALETPDEPPKTGDTQLVAPFVLLIGLSVAGLVVVLTAKKKFF